MQENTKLSHTLYDTDSIEEYGMNASKGTPPKEETSGHPDEKMSLTENNIRLGKERSQKETDTGHWDRGWAWMVAIGSSISNFILTGCMFRSQGILLNEVVERFQNPAAYSISIFLSMGFSMLFSEYYFDLIRKFF